MTARMGWIAAFLWSIVGIDARGDATQSPPILREVALRQNLNAQVPLDDPFTDERGEPTTLRACMSGKTTLLVLAYYRCPRLCTEVLNDLTTGLGGVPWNIGEEFNVVTVSFDDRESSALAAAKKQSYLERYGRRGAENGWHFLTGRQQSILKLANAVGFEFRYDPKNDQFAHPSCVMVLTPDGRVSRYLLRLRDPNPSRSSEFSRDLRLAMVEASDRRIGTETESVLLFCYRYDPQTGKYTMTALRLVRGAGIVTVLGLGSVLFLMWRRDWRKAHAA